MSGPEWDLVCAGAGPAGAAAALGALTVDPSLRVLLLDRADFPRDKSCGDGLAPHAVDVLRAVGAGDVVDGWAPVQRLEITRGTPGGGRGVAGRMRRPAWVIPRAVLDARLVERAVAAGAVLRRQRVAGLSVAAGRVVLADGTTAGVLVGADGAHSVVRAAVAPGRTGRRALAIRGYVPTAPAWRGRQVIRYGERSQPAYAWAFDRGDGLANVGYGELVDGVPLSRALLLEQLELLLPGATGAGADAGWLGHLLPLSGWRWHQPDGPVLLVGDAAGLVNPMTGEGLYYAVATGVLAGRTAARVARDAPAAAGAAHRHAVRQLLGAHLRHTSVAARLARHPAVVDAGLRAAGRSRPAFDALVEIGLGGGRITPRLAAGIATGLLRGAAGPADGVRPSQTPRPSPPTHH